MNLDRVHDYLMAQSRLVAERAKTTGNPDERLKFDILTDLYAVLAAATIEAQMPHGVAWAPYEGTK